jgi:hypothetical protein
MMKARNKALFYVDAAYSRCGLLNRTLISAPSLLSAHTRWVALCRLLRDQPLEFALADQAPQGLIVIEYRRHGE